MLKGPFGFGTHRDLVESAKMRKFIL